MQNLKFLLNSLSHHYVGDLYIFKFLLYHLCLVLSSFTWYIFSLHAEKFCMLFFSKSTFIKWTFSNAIYLASVLNSLNISRVISVGGSKQFTKVISRLFVYYICILLTKLLVRQVKTVSHQL